mmetsp:Transcript_38991/g.59298  ORF Transcript_38991/g.59298 Transcript_38991/m.59298 type:complete len:172 (+) Transcript_38991:5412-5927(+)
MLFYSNLLELIFNSLHTMLAFKQVLLSKRAQYDDRMKDDSSDLITAKMKKLSGTLVVLSSDKIAEKVIDAIQFIRRNPLVMEKNVLTQEAFGPIYGKIIDYARILKLKEINSSPYEIGLDVVNEEENDEEEEVAPQPHLVVGTEEGLQPLRRTKATATLNVLELQKPFLNQ